MVPAHPHCRECEEGDLKDAAHVLLSRPAWHSITEYDVMFNISHGHNHNKTYEVDTLTYSTIYSIDTLQKAWFHTLNNECNSCKNGSDSCSVSLGIFEVVRFTMVEDTGTDTVLK